jgi:hypothetical protein
MFTQELILVRISQRYYGADPRLVKNMDDDQNWSQYHTLHFTSLHVKDVFLAPGVKRRPLMDLYVNTLPLRFYVILTLKSTYSRL